MNSKNLSALIAKQDATVTSLASLVKTEFHRQNKTEKSFPMLHHHRAKIFICPIQETEPNNHKTEDIPVISAVLPGTKIYKN